MNKISSNIPAADRIATITLNRPDKLNAVSDEVVRHSTALHRFDLDPEAEVAILNGKGRAFSSGADVRQRQLRSREEFEKLGGPQGRGANSADLLTRAVNWKPVIAAVHGYVLGLALGLTLECDLIVAAEGTRFQLTETSRGLGASRYWALFHYRNAAAFGDEIALTGRFFTAEEALAAGIINRLAPEGKHLDVARELALQVAKNPPLFGADHGAHPALVHGAADPRGAVLGGAVPALFDRGFSRGGARLYRKAPAAPVQGAVTKWTAGILPAPWRNRRCQARQPWPA